MTDKKQAAALPLAVNDWYKTNGLPRGSTDLICPPEEGMTRQEYKEECDINTIMQQYDKYLADPMLAMRAASGRYLDLESAPQTLMESMQVLHDAEKAFMRLPATVRREFDNNPVAFTDYALDPRNIDQMRAWGLAPPKVEPAPPMKVQVVPDPKAPAPKEPIAEPPKAT